MGWIGGEGMAYANANLPPPPEPRVPQREPVGQYDMYCEKRGDLQMSTVHQVRQEFVEKRLRRQQSVATENEVYALMSARSARSALIATASEISERSRSASRPRAQHGSQRRCYSAQPDRCFSLDVSPTLHSTLRSPFSLQSTPRVISTPMSLTGHGTIATGTSLALPAVPLAWQSLQHSSPHLATFARPECASFFPPPPLSMTIPPRDSATIAPNSNSMSVFNNWPSQASYSSSGQTELPAQKLYAVTRLIAGVRRAGLRTTMDAFKCLWRHTLKQLMMLSTSGSDVLDDAQIADDRLRVLNGSENIITALEDASIAEFQSVAATEKLLDTLVGLRILHFVMTRQERSSLCGGFARLSSHAKYGQPIFHQMSPPVRVAGSITLAPAYNALACASSSSSSSSSDDIDDSNDDAQGRRRRSSCTQGFSITVLPPAPRISTYAKVPILQSVERQLPNEQINFLDQLQAKLNHLQCEVSEASSGVECDGVPNQLPAPPIPTPWSDASMQSRGAHLQTPPTHGSRLRETLRTPSSLPTAFRPSLSTVGPVPAVLPATPLPTREDLFADEVTRPSERRSLKSAHGLRSVPAAPATWDPPRATTAQQHRQAVGFSDVNSEVKIDYDHRGSVQYSECGESEWWSNSRSASRKQTRASLESDSTIYGRPRERSQSLPIHRKFSHREVAKRSTVAAEALRVPKDASRKTVTKAFYTAARVHHPDKGGDKDDFQVLSEAYKKLVNAGEVSV